jgi:AcrR family transcriptional regulator
VNNVAKSTSPEPARRRYRSELRVAQARDTRRRIVRAAAELFQQRGYTATTMPAIAELAGVSVVSVQATGPKGALLLAALEMVSTGAEGFDSVLETEAIGEIIHRSTSAAEMVRRTASFAAASNARTVRLWLALDRAADEDAGVAAAYRQLLTTMRADTRAAVQILRTRGRMRTDRTPDELADVLWALVLPDLYHRFVVQAGWSPARYEEWLTRTLQDELLADTTEHQEEA